MPSLGYMTNRLFFKKQKKDELLANSIDGSYRQALAVLKLAYAYQTKTRWHEVEPSILLSKSELVTAD